MAGKTGTSGKIAREYCEQYPNAKTLTLAKLIVKENPGVYPSLDACRCAIRYVRGNMGKIKRERNVREGNDDLHRENGEPSYAFPLLPEPIREFDGDRSLPVDAKRTLILCDVHIPYHDLDALTLALDYGSKHDVDCVILNGDFMDCAAVSRWEKDPRNRDFPREIEATRQALGYLRARFPKARMIFKDGNHEERWEAYMFTRAPELLGMKEMFELRRVLRLEEQGIEYVGRMQHIAIGRLNVVHGHEFGKGGGVNPARWLFLKANATALCGHFHRTSDHAEPDMEGRVTSCWSVGALSQLRMRYSPYNKWNQGFAYVESDGRNFEVQNKRIIEGGIY